MLDLLFPSRCDVCATVGPSPCETCAQRLRPAGEVPVPAGLDSCLALLEYEGAARQLITALKYRNRRSALPRLVAALAALPLAPVDEITWAPTSTARRRLRGFDQAELVARSLGHRLRVPCRGRLRRVSVGAQTGRSLLERLDGPIFSPRGAPCPRVALIDDVVTTGATLSAAARVLRRAGADEVHAVVVARTPRAT